MEIRKRPDGKLELDFTLLGGPYITLTQVQWNALCDWIRKPSSR